MYQVTAALKEFFSGFDLPAYYADTVPKDTELPYITFSVSEPEWDQKASGYARVWDRSQSNVTILRTADAINEVIGQGVKIDLPEGYLVIWPETPRSQILTDGDYRYAYIGYSINAYHLPGV